MGRRRGRSEAAEFELYSASGPLGVRFVRCISAKAADAMCQSGSAKLFFHEEAGKYVYQVVEPTASRIALEISRQSCSVLSKLEVNAIAGEFGESRTASLSKQQRTVLEDLKLESYDFVERSQVKLSAFDPRNGRKVSAA